MLSAYLNLQPLVRIAEIRCNGIFLLRLDADDDGLLQSPQAGGRAGREPRDLPSVRRLLGKVPMTR